MSPRSHRLTAPLPLRIFMVVGLLLLAGCPNDSDEDEDGETLDASGDLRPEDGVGDASDVDVLTDPDATGADGDVGEAACRHDGDCPNGEVCELGGPGCDTPVCTPGCHQHEDCGEGASCAQVECVTCPCPGHCVTLRADAACRSDADCGAGQVCELGGPDCDTPACVTGCHANRDCGDGEACSAVTCVTCPCPGVCVALGEESACRGDADCGAGEVCELGGPGCDTPTCVSGCHADRDCGEGEVCIEVDCVTCPCPGVCAPIETGAECASDADCGAGEVCELGGPGCISPVCVPGCRGHEDCGPGRVCREVTCVTCPCPDQCLDSIGEPECGSDSQCPDGQVCELGGPGCTSPVCVPGCHRNADCGEGQVCETVYCITCPCPGHCADLIPEPECLGDRDCPDGQVCELGGPGCTSPVCVPGCHRNTDCDEGEVCEEVFCVTCPCPGHCAELPPEPTCEGDEDCAPGEVCELGGPECGEPVCVRGCHRDADCDEGQFCDEVVCVTCPCPGHCADLPPEPECGGDDDCPVGQVCEPGGPGCGEPVCVPGCRTNEDCGEGETCQEVYCFTCPCPPQCLEGPAGECRDDADCVEGEVCELGGPGCSEPVCVSGCHGDGDCGEGETCQEVYCFTCPCPGICMSR